MASRYSRTSSDTLKLRRLITSLKTSGSDLATKLEDQSAQIFGGVQIVRSDNPCISKQVAAILRSRVYDQSLLFLRTDLIVTMKKIQVNSSTMLIISENKKDTKRPNERRKLREKK